MPKPALFRFIIAIFLLSTGFGIMTPAVPLYASVNFSVNEWQLGLLGTLAAVPYIFAPAFFGRLSDSVGRRLLIMGGLSLYIITSISYAFASSIIELAVLRIFEGISFALIWPSAEAFLADHTLREERSAAIGLYSVSWSSGYMVGPFIMGALVSFTGIAYSFILTAILMALSLCLMLMNKSDHAPKQYTEEIEEKSSIRFPVVFYTMIIWGFAVLAFFFIFPDYARGSGISLPLIGYLVGLAGLFRTLVFVFNNRIAGALKNRMVPVGMALLSLSMFVAWGAPSIYGFIICVALLGLSFGLIYAYSLGHILNKPAKGLYAGLFESSIGVGELAGPLTMGYLGFSLYPSFPFLFLALIGAGSIAVTAKIVKKSFR